MFHVRTICEVVILLSASACSSSKAPEAAGERGGAGGAPQGAGGSTSQAGAAGDHSTSTNGADGGTRCNEVPVTEHTFVETRVESSPPAPTGGSIESGLYHIESVTLYDPQKRHPLTKPISGAWSYRFSSGNNGEVSVEQRIVQPEQDTAINQTWVPSETNLKEKQTCFRYVELGQVSPFSLYHYSASADAVTEFYNYDDGATSVTVYKRDGD